MVKYLPSHLFGLASTNIKIKDRFPSLLLLWVALFARNITLGNQLIATAGELLCVVVVRLNAVDEQDVSGLGDSEFAAVLYAEASPADVDDEQRRIAVALHIVIVGAEIVTAPGRVEQQVFRSLRWSERETYGFAENTGAL